MNDQKDITSQLYGLLPKDLEGVDELTGLAMDLRWSWNHEADELWQQLDPDLWELTNNPWIVLQTVSRDQLKKLLSDTPFRHKMKELGKLKEHNLSRETWFQKNHQDTSLTHVAYFSMEFMLNEALPIYVGGLGNVAGDQLKSASDLGVPVVAVGLLYQQGYFHQVIDQYGNQEAHFPYNDPGQLPVTPLRLPNGEWLRLKISLAGYPVWLRTWQVLVGRIKLYLMDSNDLANLPAHRGITSELYGGGPELRIQQEIILGIGGWKLLRALNIHPEVCHMNEGHSAFLVLERACDFRKDNGVTFQEALAITRAGNLFTTHTAVAAGFDHFSPSLMWQYFGDYSRGELGIDFNDLLALGRQHPEDYSENFNMAYLAIRGSGAVNGVSSLHGEVSRKLFNCLFPRWPTNEVPVGSVTNGVHMPSWDSQFADEIWTKSCGKDRWRGGLEKIQNDIFSVSDEDLWRFRNKSRNELVTYIRKRFERQVAFTRQTQEIIEITRKVFNPDILTLGFARRFVPYKRPNLLLHDPERFIRLLTNRSFPVQLVIAGKAPPFDESGKALIRQWVQFISQHNLYNHIVFLSDYDMLLTEHLVQGVDVWINTPRRPWEACGTSGMKVLVNGGINLSELDGWWAEAYTPEVGWAIGDRKERGEDPDWDAEEAGALYYLLEQEVIPAFYSRSEEGIPGKWIEKMRHSMAILTPRFSANRTVRQYTEKYYLPSAKHFVKRSAKKGAEGRRIINSHRELLTKWSGVRFGNISIDNLEDGYMFHLHVLLNGISHGDVLVELFANGINSAVPEKIIMKFDSSSVLAEEHIYYAQVRTKRLAADYTARIFPQYKGISVPLENNLILWQK